MPRRGRIYVGTSGWSYRHWKGPFYPEDARGQDMLPFYAKQLDTVEINGSFYGLPARASLEAWLDVVPKRFVFAAKASRYITHMKRLKDVGRPLRSFYERMETLGERLGPILFQLPPRWRSNPERLEEFLSLLSADHRHTFEFRDPSWFDDRVREVLERHGAAFCIYQLAGRESPREVTADFAYVRLHGPDGAYKGRYDRRALSGWNRTCDAWRRQGLDVYVYFDNDDSGYAARNAVELDRMKPGGRGKTRRKRA